MSWLAGEAIRRYLRLNQASLLLPDERVLEIRKTRGHILLDLEDEIVDVLDDNEFVNVIMEHDEIGRADTNSTMLNDLHSIMDPIQNKVHLPTDVVVMDGQNLTIHDLVVLGRGQSKIKLRKVAEERVVNGRNIVEGILRENRVVYGITTGFGKFARTVISKDKLELLQENLIRSHSAGVGQPLSVDRVRMLLALRINILAKGHSGVSLKTLNQMIAAFNASCLPWVPEQGTVGASGDLAPLSHLALGMWYTTSISISCFGIINKRIISYI